MIHSDIFTINNHMLFVYNVHTFVKPQTAILRKQFLVDYGLY